MPQRQVFSMMSLMVASVLAMPVFSGAASDGSLLLKALREGDDARAIHRIEQRANVNVRDETGATALMWAAQRGNTELTRRLLAAGADPNLHDEQGLSPLQIALEVQATEVALQLIARRANPNAARESGETVLMTAARTGQLEVMRQLIARGAKVNAREKQFHQTALMWSAGHPEQVKLLIEHGADIRARTKVWEITNTVYTQLSPYATPWLHEGEYVSQKGGQTALFFAVQQDDLESVKALLDAGSDVDDRAADGFTALLLALYKWNPGGKHYALRCDLELYPVTFAPNFKIANLLLDHQAKVTLADATGYTPLHGAVLGTVPRIQMEKCNDPGLQVESVNNVRETAVASREGLALVKRLLHLKADPNAQTRYPTAGPVGAVRINHAYTGSTPVHIAVGSNNADLMKLLLQHGGNPNLIRDDGHSPLSLATQADDLPLVELMVAGGGDVKHAYNPIDLITDAYKVGDSTQIGHPRRNQTLLHIAAVAGSHKVVPFLIAHGTPLNQKNDKGETPLALAEAQERVRYARGKNLAFLAKTAFPDPKVRDPDDIVLETRTSDAIKRLMRVKAAEAPT